MTTVDRRRALLSALVFSLLAPGRSMARGYVIFGHHVLDDSDPRVVAAKALLDAAPTSGTPFEVAKYFVTNVPARFQYAWPEPDAAHPTDANPLIVEFFRQMGASKDGGDTTPWCAAFVNWCIARVGLKGTGSPASQSFLRLPWLKPIWAAKGGGDLAAAKTGDILVFTSSTDAAHGHVAFFSRWIDEKHSTLEMLGGNQIQPGDHLHVIDFKRRSNDDGTLFLNAILSAPALH
jgi:uncharacterized protein (TIGR02594 family)